MTEQVIASPRYVRAKPAEWDGLVTETAGIIGESELIGKLSLEQLSLALAQVAPLNNEQLEESRFYGLGLAICSLGRYLSDPSNRQEVVNEASRRLAFEIEKGSSIYGQKRIFKPNGGNLKLNEIRNVFANQFTVLSQASLQGIPFAERLLTESLQVMSDERMGMSGITYDSKTDLEVRLARTETGKGVSLLVGSSMFAASLVVSKLAMKAKHEGEDDPVVHVAELKALDVSSIAPRFASLRLDEFIDSQRGCPYVSTDDDGSLIFIKDQFPKEPPPLTSRDVLHEKRLKCPALHVAGMLPLARDVLTEIISQADDQLSSRAGPRDRILTRLMGQTTIAEALRDFVIS